MIFTPGVGQSDIFRPAEKNTFLVNVRPTDFPGIG
jgi:hypothetical protein